MNYKKEKRLLVEPTEDEVKKLAQVIAVIIREVIYQFRASCLLSLCQAATMLGTTRKSLSAHEKGDKMYVSTFCRVIAGFLLFMKYNKMGENEKLRKLIAELQELLTI